MQTQGQAETASAIRTLTGAENEKEKQIENFKNNDTVLSYCADDAFMWLPHKDLEQHRSGRSGA